MERYVEEKRASKHMTIKVFVGVQFLLSISFLFGIKRMNIVPTTEYLGLVGILAVLFSVSFVMLFVKHKVSLLGLWLSVLTCIGLGVGVYYLSEANTAIKAMVGATYKTEDLIVVVKEENSAKNIQDAKKYTFAQSITLDANSSQKIVDDIKKRTGKVVTITQYATLNEVVNALLEGKVDAAIYNESFAPMIARAVAGYANQVKTIHKLTIQTKIIQNKNRTVTKPFNLYLSGVDIIGSINKSSKSELNMIATINPITKQMLLTTVPRDYFVQFPGVSGEQKDKLSHAGMYGIEKAVTTLEQLYDTKIDYYAKVNFSSLIDVVDLLGGIDMQLTQPFSAGNYQFEKGMNHMNGAQALAFSRAEQEGKNIQGYNEGNQAAVLDAMIQKIMLPFILKKADVLIGDVSESVKTNMTKSEMTQLIHMQIDNNTPWGIDSIISVGTEDHQGVYSYAGYKEYVINPDMNSVHAIREKMKQVKDGAILT